MKEWRPPQAFDALIEFEPDAEVTYTCAVGLQNNSREPTDSPLQQIGTDKRPSAKWIKKTWNSLGSHLHAEWPFASSRKSRKSPRPFFEETLRTLGPLVDNSFSFVMLDTISFSCTACSAKVEVMRQVVESTHHAMCLSCGVRHRAEASKGSFMFYALVPPFTCDCGAGRHLPLNQIKVGYVFDCPACKREFKIVAHEWKYVLASDMQEAIEDDV